MAPSTGGEMAVPSRDGGTVVPREGMADKAMEAGRYPEKAVKGIPGAGHRRGMVQDGIITPVIIRVIIRSPKRTGRVLRHHHPGDTGADKIERSNLLNRTVIFNRTTDRLLFICTIHNFTLLKL
jgi:hypothetical protein